MFAAKTAAWIPALCTSATCDGYFILYSSYTRTLLSSVYQGGNKYKELICNHPFVAAFIFRGRNAGLRVIWETGGLAAMYSLVLVVCVAALTHSALAAKGKCPPLSNSHCYPGVWGRESGESKGTVKPLDISGQLFWMGVLWKLFLVFFRFLSFISTVRGISDPTKPTWIKNEMH